MRTNRKPWGVKGLTDDPRAPIVAKAKIGEKGDKGQPKRLDYVIFVEPQTGRRIPEFQEVFGEKPTEFKALLAGDTLEQNIDVAWKRYGKQGLKCRGDGETGFDRETGEERQCAGEYNFDDQSQHECPFARPNGNKPPECKPVLSMRLVVPQVPGLGLVQLDTGGVASSIQTLVWQLRMIEQMTAGHMAGIAVRVSIRAFPDKFGNAAYSWQIEPLKGDAAQELRTSVEPFVRLEAQLPKALPELEESIDPDIYGLPAPEEEPPVPGIPGEWAEKVNAAEKRVKAALIAAQIPQAKAESLCRKIDNARDKASATDAWEAYLEWLEMEATQLETVAGNRREAMV